MALTFDWKGHDGSGWNFTVGTTNVIGFYGPGGYGSPIQVGQYNDGQHVRTSTADDTDACSPPHLTNIKYTSDTEMSINGGAPVALTSATQENLIQITVTSDSNITIIGSRMYGYDGANVDNPPANLLFKTFKLGDTTWTQPHGRTNAMDCGTSTTPATSHNFYIGLSLSPTSTGASTLFVSRFEVDIQ